MADFVVSAPHSLCRPGEDSVHICDRQAKKFAEWLKNELTCGSVKIHKADVHRSECDLNRIECRDRPYRKRIVEDIESWKTVVVDAHSYPPAE